MSVYPRNMSAFLNKLSGYNKQNVKLNVLGSKKTIVPREIQKDWRPLDPRVTLPRARQVVAFKNNR